MRKQLQKSKKDLKFSKNAAEPQKMSEAERRYRRQLLLDEIVRLTILKNKKAQA